MSDYPQENIENRIIEKRIGKFVEPTTPQVSVVIPCYNNSALIAETLQTVFAQTYTDYEIVLVNDGSPDTEKLETNIERFLDKIVYIKQKNTGVAGARNIGIYYSRGNYIAFLDGDDLWLPTYLESQMKFLLKNAWQMIYCDAWLIGGKAWEGKTYMGDATSNGSVSVKSLISAECNVITSGTIVKKSNIEESNGFDENREISGFEDYDLWLRLARQGCRIGYQREVLLKYRVSITGLSGSNISRAERVVQSLNYIRQKIQLSDDEILVWKECLVNAQAQLELEKGKLYLTKEEFKEALYHLSKANKTFHRKKISVAMWLIKYQPHLAKKLFKSFRTNDFDFITAGSKE